MVSTLWMVALLVDRLGNLKVHGFISREKMQIRLPIALQRDLLERRLLVTKSEKHRLLRCVMRLIQKEPLPCSLPFSLLRSLSVYAKNFTSNGTWTTKIFQNR